MGTLLTASGWLAVVLCAAVGVSWGLRIATANRWKERTPREWITPLPFALAAVVILTLLGVIAPLTGGMVAGIMAAGSRRRALAQRAARRTRLAALACRGRVRLLRAGTFAASWTRWASVPRQIFTRDGGDSLCVGSRSRRSPAPCRPAVRARSRRCAMTSALGSSPRTA